MTSIDELRDTYIQESVLNEATRQPTVPTGTYLFQVQRYYLVESDNPSAAAALFGTVEQNGQILGRLSTRVSWEELRRPDGTLDGQTKRFAQLLKALGLEKTTSVADVLEAATKYPVMVRLVERWKNPGNGEYVDAESEENRKELRLQGYQPANYVVNLWKVR